MEPIKLPILKDKIEFKFPEHISYSALKTWRTCPWKWKLEYVDKFRELEEKGIYLDFGKAIHRTIELSFNNGKKPAITYPLRHFTKVFKLLYYKNFYDYKDREKELKFEDMLVSGIRIIEEFLSHEVIKNYKVLKNELKLFVPIARTENVEIKFKGFIDLVIMTKDGRGKPVIYLCDFKTCKWGWKAEDKADTDRLDQLFLYKYFLCKEFKVDQSQVRCSFILMKRNPSKGTIEAKNVVEIVPISAGPVVVQRSVEKFNKNITEMINMFNSGDIKKNRRSCVDEKFHSETYKSVCKYLNTSHCPGHLPGLRTIISGGRDIENYEEVLKAIKNSGFQIDQVISGKARGVDTLGEQWAKENNIPVKECPADWGKYGKIAGPIRNGEMAKIADALIVIYDGKSKGSSDMLAQARSKNLKIHVHIVAPF